MLMNALGLGDIMLCGSNNQNLTSWADGESPWNLTEAEGKENALYKTVQQQLNGK